MFCLRDSPSLLVSDCFNKSFTTVTGTSINTLLTPFTVDTDTELPSSTTSVPKVYNSPVTKCQAYIA